ncbi:Tetratricopeptide repeat protein 30 homolog [Caenorhabditis elegans]|uniref:Tetratricopeptide repeat protein 30 homolog n=2 Tax=Caenorhabditis elegans TaxID=6239 RepID=TTC30_CAEEL|nr:Tetratricopeptide repeat protein 30 homolog [Caenorhabditis elegans]Q8I7G4.1 RecName: Full=Tetratricopeptide repeat protein 30 homolog; Short=TPR repeat protein 30 homolog; AltName: Full=Abnormal dye filling protein 1 [Caenorhabditis elegans]CCD67546.1 Tetratricopeptide repeat protein 30 homolog [Caenorhabditis elegans]|eukprot:NP_491494.2 Tetratricopeptide repeat protein 30 homolog [Caenorhabditis elegans]
MNAMLNIKEGEFTSTIYTLIHEHKFNDAIRILQYQHERNPKNLAALSLLAYCYYYTQDFMNAADCYSQLSYNFPQYSQYKLYHAQSLYNAFRPADALAVVSMIQDENLLNESVKLEAAIKYQEDDLVNCRILVEQLPENDAAVIINTACIDYKEGNYEEALKKFNEATEFSGYQSGLAYSIALCHYRRGDYDSALKLISEIINRGVKDHPEFNIGMVTEGIDVNFIQNTQKLHESALIEAFNLKFAIYYRTKDFKAAKESLTDMPPRNEHDADPITLHNLAISNANSDFGDSSAKLQFLLGINPFPQETFANLLFLYCKNDYFGLAADVLAENPSHTFYCLNEYQFNLLEALIYMPTNPEESLKKLEKLEKECLDRLRKTAIEIQIKKEQKTTDSDDSLEMRNLIESYDDSLEMYLPVLMTYAKYYWDKRDYQAVEKLFRNSVDYCKEHDTWKLNVAHTIFMQEKKYKDAAAFYEPIVHKKYDDGILEVPAMILANLVVCYIMTNQTDEAELILKAVENEEEAALMMKPNEKFFHNSIISLVIGSLYCSKGNFEFGISRVVKALEPPEKKLGVDTWYYAKRCIVAAIELMAKNLLVMRDSVVMEVIQFLTSCEVPGRNIYTVPDDLFEQAGESKVKCNVTYEARMIKAALLMVFND